MQQVEAAPVEEPRFKLIFCPIVGSRIIRTLEGCADSCSRFEGCCRAQWLDAEPVVL